VTPKTNPSQSLAEAVSRLRGFLARALIGEDDPSVSEAAKQDIACIEALYDGPEKERVSAFADVMRRPSAVSGVSRQVVLARGQRFLFSLSMALEDEVQDTTSETDMRRETAAPMTPFDPALLKLPGIGPKTASRLSSRGIASPRDLLFFLPRRYDDRRTITPVSELKEGLRTVTLGRIEQVRFFGPPWRQTVMPRCHSSGFRNGVPRGTRSNTARSFARPGWSAVTRSVFKSPTR
jgi:hypothetical protein